jgi:hypothetical protein
MWLCLPVKRATHSIVVEERHGELRLTRRRLSKSTLDICVNVRPMRISPRCRRASQGLQGRVVAV